ncbi:MAG: VWA domain-containing protein [Pseudomonas sp.]|jgi:Ca-activated chloride channel family protein|nr:VWA domain-containing protein [Pseudomonas sp.]
MKPLYSFLLAGLVAATASASLAAEQTMIVLDASGSMWGQINGKPKLQIAREALATVLEGVPADMELGLIAYGHRTRGSCSDIEVVVKPAAGTGPEITQAAAKMKFLGKTPLSASVLKAAEELRYTEDKATVILITDGLENCQADPCAVGAELAKNGIDFTAHVVGFDLTDAEGKQVACLAENTGGRYVSAANADELRDALLNTMVQPAKKDTPKEPEPLLLPEATLDPDESVAIGGDINVKWTGPNAENDYIDLVPQNYKKTYDELTFTYTKDGSPLTVRAAGKPGTYTVRYIWRGSDNKRHVLAEATVAVTDSDVALVAPDTVQAGGMIAIQWKGPANERDYVDLVADGVKKTSGELTYVYTNTKTEPEVELRAPTKPGVYNIRYVLSGEEQKRVLDSIPITVTEATASVSAPEQIEAGAVIPIFWTGPAGERDYVDIVPTEHKRIGGELTLFYTKDSEDGESHELQAPTKAGEYQVRYILRGSGADRVLVKQPFTVIAADGSVSVPESVVAGSVIAVEWTGPANHDDYVDIVPVDHKRIGGELTYFYTRNSEEGEPDQLKAPTKAGEYRVRYILRGAGAASVLTQQTFTVVAAEGGVSVPESVPAGSVVQVEWSGPANYDDYVDIVPVDHKRIGGEVTFFYTRDSEEGEPDQLKAPAKAGEYYVRYILRGSGAASVLTKQAFTVSKPDGSVSVPASVKAESMIPVEWSGPANHDDYVDIVPADHKRIGGELTYFYTRSSEEDEPDQLKAPSKAGEYQVRYILRGSGQAVVLAKQAFTVTDN